MALEFTELRLLSELEGGGNPGAESSILKIKECTEIQQRLTQLFVEASTENLLFLMVAQKVFMSNVKPNGPEYTNEVLSKYLQYEKSHNLYMVVVMKFKKI